MKKCYSPLLLLCLFGCSASQVKMGVPAPSNNSVLNFTDFGASPADPLTGEGPDCTPAFNKAAAIGGVLNIPPGKWRFATPPNTIGRTLLIKGSGIVHTGERGTILIADYNNADFLVWDAHEAYLGGGSGIDGCTLYKGQNRTGGVAIKVLTLSPSQREGWFQLDRVLVGGYLYSNTNASWDNCLLMDGTSTPNPPGLRDSWVTRCTFCGAVKPAVSLNGVAASYWSGIQIFGGNQPSGDLTITGTAAVPSQSCYFNNIEVFGKVTIGYATLFSYQGLASNMQIMDTANNGIIDVIGMQGSVLDGSGAVRKYDWKNVWVRQP